uniref:Uncharacterized protein n=1 Tax=Junco hyemalis TaxID=40217 RepID=A0A8C5J3F8_JUNHY
MELCEKSLLLTGAILPEPTTPTLCKASCPHHLGGLGRRPLRPAGPGSPRQRPRSADTGAVPSLPGARGPVRPSQPPRPGTAPPGGTARQRGRTAPPPPLPADVAHEAAALLVQEARPAVGRLHPALPGGAPVLTQERHGDGTERDQHRDWERRRRLERCVADPSRTRCGPEQDSTRSGAGQTGAEQGSTLSGAGPYPKRRQERCGGCERAPRYLCDGSGRVLPEARAGPAPPHVAVFIGAGPARGVGAGQGGASGAARARLSAPPSLARVRGAFALPALSVVCGKR